MEGKVLKNKSIETISQRVLYAILGITVLIFAAFYLIGYDTPFVNDASFNAPLLTDGVLFWMYVLVFITIAFMFYSLYQSIRTIKVEGKIINGIPARKITYIVFAGTFVLMILTFLFGSTSSMQINGIVFSDKFWLQVTDMFVNTILLMLSLSVVVVIFGATRYRRSRRMQK
ncbi:MAG: hypothetical protein E6507_02110 [Prevotella bivia]|uniref:Uncharacterized protein n=1 Tax=Prevotella bivia TaxID=28125 RepID=A0A137SRA5_9BACT|nr:hypothetical protein [Prevotella bivia]KXO14901.1 hypothetical protein HMPREF3202_02263 [Prevotella bivia]MDU6553675.1 hypothetical protein [Prevotella bivia]